MSDTASAPGIDFDPDTLRARYHEERERRVRYERAAASVLDSAATGADADPYTPVVPRAAHDEEVEVLIVGGGFAGLLAGASLKERGITDFRIVEKAGDFGGVWYWNRYPGAQCDVESYIYLPLLEETGFIPKEKYSYQPEIFAHAQRIGRHFGLYDTALFHTNVREMAWSQADSRWHVTTDRADRIRARFIILAGGGLDRPKTPKIAGLDSFRGKTFHTSRWDYDYTGGGTAGGMTRLADKRVAILGTGATAIQCVPFIAQDAGHLYVIQRTPSVVGERLNRPTDPAWAASLEPGWQRRRMANYTSLVLGGRQDEDLVDDGWTHATRALASVYGGDWDNNDTSPEQVKLNAEIADFAYMNKLRARVDQTVSDARTAEALKPWYRYFCKRPLFNDEFLPAFNRPNVELIDISASGGIERMTATGFVVDGIERPIDCLIFASGFGADASARDGFDVQGRDGVTLSAHWRDGARTLHGAMMHGFPNLFLMGIVHTGFTINYVEMAQTQANHIGELLGAIRAKGIATLEPTAEAEAEYVAEIVKGAELNFDFHASCTPGYFNNEGRHVRHGKGVTNAQFAAGLLEWDKMVSAWRAEGNFRGMTVR
jgi:cation diffusion facilitator CzcD-associated flavoprotein CzcO